MKLSTKAPGVDEVRSEVVNEVPDEEVQKAELLKSLVVLSIFGQLFVGLLSIFCRFSSSLVNLLSIFHSFWSSLGISFSQPAVLIILDSIGDYSLVFRDFSVFWFIFGCTFDLLCTGHFISSWSCTGHCPAWYTSLVPSTPTL